MSASELSAVRAQADADARAAQDAATALSAKHDSALVAAFAAASTQLRDTVDSLEQKHTDALKSLRSEHDKETSTLKAKLEKAQSDFEVRSS